MHAPAVQGVLLSGPFPILEQPDLISQFASWTFTVGSPAEMLQLLPAATKHTAAPYTSIPTLPLLSNDPLAAEQFCVVLTAGFSLVMVLGETAAGHPAFLFSFDPSVVWQVWRSLQARLKLAAPYALAPLTGLIEQFAPVAPDYQTVVQFSRLMLTHLPDATDWDEGRTARLDSDTVETVATSIESLSPSDASVWQPASQSWQQQVAQTKAARSHVKPEPRQTCSTECFASADSGSDTELLQAIAHEVRTPLTTIRTLTRLLLKRKDLNPDVIKRLEIIDRECTEQIDRFNLIFRAVELETTKTSSPLSPLAPISLDQVIQQNIPRWQQQASQHNHTLDVVLPQKLPMVVTDPTMLDQALTGLIDRITHSLPPGSQIQVRVSLAGHQLKLQFESKPQVDASSDGSDGKAKFSFTPALKSIGQLLMFQPETGNLSLNMAVTKNLFQALGGKLVVRQRPQQGEELTVFLPLETKQNG
jgi:signal transduction histidine kinase